MQGLNSSFFWCAGILVGAKIAVIRGKTSSFSLGKKKQKPERPLATANPLFRLFPERPRTITCCWVSLGRVSAGVRFPVPGTGFGICLRSLCRRMRPPLLGCGEGMIAALDEKKRAYHRNKLKVVRAVGTANPAHAVKRNCYCSFFLLRKCALSEGQSTPRGWLVFNPRRGWGTGGLKAPSAGRGLRGVGGRGGPVRGPPCP